MKSTLTDMLAKTQKKGKREGPQHGKYELLGTIESITWNYMLGRFMMHIMHALMHCGNDRSALFFSTDLLEPFLLRNSVNIMSPGSFRNDIFVKNQDMTLLWVFLLFLFFYFCFSSGELFQK